MSCREEIRAALIQIVMDETGEKDVDLCDEVLLASQLGLDSVDMVSLVMQVERLFKVRLTHEELSGVAKVGELLDLVEAKMERGEYLAAA